MKYQRTIFTYSVSDECTYSYEINIPMVFVDSGQETIRNAIEVFKIKSLVALEECEKGRGHNFYFQGHLLDVNDFWKITDTKKTDLFYDQWVKDGELVEINETRYLFAEPTIITVDDYFKMVEHEAMIR